VQLLLLFMPRQCRALSAPPTSGSGEWLSWFHAHVCPSTLHEKAESAVKSQRQPRSCTGSGLSSQLAQRQPALAHGLDWSAHHEVPSASAKRFTAFTMNAHLPLASS